MRDEAQFRLVYQCIESPQPMDFHEARIQIIPESDDRCRLIWEADIRPEQFKPFLKGSMEGALRSAEGSCRIECWPSVSTFIETLILELRPQPGLIRF